MKYYREHRKEYTEYLHAQNILNDVVDEYLVAFQKTQPHSPCYDGLNTGSRKNKVEEYIIEVERNDLKRRAEDAERALHLKQELVSLKEDAVRSSCDVYDLIYAAKWIDHKKTKALIRDLDFKGICISQSQVYNIIHRIAAEIGEA